MAITEPTIDTGDQADDDHLAAQATTDDELVEDEVLVEEISIDGMCGVY